MESLLKKYREKTLKITQKEMSKRLGISNSSYMRYENAHRKIPSDVLEKISNMSNIPIKKLILDNNRKFSKQAWGELEVKSQNIKGNDNIQILGEHNSEHNSIVKQSSKDENTNELIELILNYATPKIVDEFKAKLLKIKQAHEEV